MMQRKWTSTALATIMMATCAAPGYPCGYHGRLGEGFSALHPRSIGVAVAIREVADEHLLDREVVAPKVVDMLALNRASRRLDRMGEALQGLSHSTQRPFSVLLIESGMWSRYEPNGSSIRLTTHTKGPLPEDAVIVTGNAVLAAIEKGRISIEYALHRGLIVIDRPIGRTEGLATAL